MKKEKKVSIIKKSLIERSLPPFTETRMSSKEEFYDFSVSLDGSNIKVRAGFPTYLYEDTYKPNTINLTDSIVEKKGKSITSMLISAIARVDVENEKIFLVKDSVNDAIYSEIEDALSSLDNVLVLRQRELGEILGAKCIMKDKTAFFNVNNLIRLPDNKWLKVFEHTVIPV